MSFSNKVSRTSQKVLKTLAQYKSMPFIELKSVCQMDIDELQESVGELELNGLVKIKEPGNPFEEIITLSSEGFKAAHFYTQLRKFNPE